MHWASDGRTRLLAAAMGSQGLTIAGMWGAFIGSGALRDGARTVENNMYLGFHVVAEFLMSVLLVIGGVAILTGRSWGRFVGMLGLGATIYSTINSLADTVRNKPKLTPVLLLNLVIAAATAAGIARRRDGAV